MQKIVFLLLLFVVQGSVSFSQRQFFIYMQADNNQPFYAKINSRMFSSTENGYMIIPKLGDSTYNIAIGFPKNAYPEQNFPVRISNKDKGFQLRNSGTNGWELVNLQNGSVITNAGTSAKESVSVTGVKKTDAFSVMLANVVNDSAILYAVAKTPAPEKPAADVVNTKPQPTNDPAINTAADTTLVAATPPAKRPDTVAKAVATSAENIVKATETPPKTNEVATIPVKPGNTKPADSVVLDQKGAVEKPFITRIEENKSETVYRATYLEQYNFRTDTIKIIIPIGESTAAITNANTTPPPVTQPTADTVVAEKKVAVEEKTPPPPKPVVVDSASARKTVQVTNSDCKALATDYDVDKLRVKLINDKTIDDKLASAKKYFKTKCFAVKQIKALTELFPSDETKYQFFDISYPFVSDSSNFYMLEELIENSYYKNRFKAMIQKN